MKTKAYKALDKLNSNFKIKVDKFVAECPEIFITESWRSEERQKELRAAGLSQVAHSNHQDGLAIDIAFKDDPKTPGVDPIYPTNMDPWRKVADVAKKYGIDWGYDLWKWDKPHFQDNGLPLISTPPKPMNKYKDILDGYIKSGFAPVFSSHEGDTPITEAEVKTLLDIGFARFAARIKK